MKKLINGVVDFCKNKREAYSKDFSHLALSQSPETLFVTCSDSRLVPNRFTSADPGELFVYRNIGNIIPKYGDKGAQGVGVSEAATLEFALNHLKVSDIVICGHSDCGAMKALLGGREHLQDKGLREWLKHADSSLAQFSLKETPKVCLKPHNHLSQINVLQQIAQLRTYPVVQEKLKDKSVRIHGWWFDITQSSVYAYEEKKGFRLIDGVESKDILENIDC